MSGQIKYQKYGNPPYHIYLIHGGPGAVGILKPLALELSGNHGVVEVYNRGLSIKEQLHEISEAIVENNAAKITLTGHSWGAWLTLIMAARFPDKIERVILISCPPLIKEHACDIMDNRINRMKDNERQEFYQIIKAINLNKGMTDDNTLKKMGELFLSTDSFKLMEEEKLLNTELDYKVYNMVWPEADEYRWNGNLLKDVNKVQCPVKAIHGDHDPHPSYGVNDILEERIRNFQFILLNQCGHYPWKEKYAKKTFYETLKKIL